MANEEEGRARSIRFPDEIWDAIDADAERWDRSSSNKHMLAIFRAYFKVNNIELADISKMRDIVNNEAKKEKAAKAARKAGKVVKRKVRKVAKKASNGS